jgi:hypothetical protein
VKRVNALQLRQSLGKIVGALQKSGEPILLGARWLTADDRAAKIAGRLALRLGAFSAPAKPR